MPLFVYHCPHGHEFEKLVRSGEPPRAADCRECTESAVLAPAVPSQFVWGKAGGWR